MSSAIELSNVVKGYKRGRENGLLQLLNQRGKTLVMVTHDARAADHAAHIVHMDKGVLLPERIAA
jgi:ABC-type lipoprotein export system ATPase subunit